MSVLCLFCARGGQDGDEAEAPQQLPEAGPRGQATAAAQAAAAQAGSGAGADNEADAAASEQQAMATGPQVRPPTPHAAAACSLQF